MCITFYYVNPAPGLDLYKLVLVVNRDEDYGRPTLGAHTWQTTPKIIAGKDMFEGREGGTWLGASHTGKICGLLNVLQPKSEFLDSNVASRGFLALNFLLNETDGHTYLQSIIDSQKVYNKFNLLTFEPHLNSYNVTFLNSDDKAIIKLDSGVHGFGNCPLRQPFKKVSKGITKMKNVVNNFGFKHREEELVEALISMMEDTESHYPDELLVAQGKGYPEHFYRGLSSTFVSIPEANYGTRTTTVILVDNNDEMFFQERTMADPSPHCKDWKVSSFRIKIETPS